MRPQRLLLDGFGTYREPADLDFSDVDFFALIGPTGAGKSTVIDALCFALYGTVPRWDNANEIRHALAPSANLCRVCLVFETAGRRYAAARVLTRDGRGVVHTKEARLDRLDPDVPVGGELTEILQASVEQIAEGPDQVKAEVESLLGLTYDHFTQCVLLPQGKFAEFLQAKPSDRQGLLVELLAFGIYEQIGQRARERARQATTTVEFAQRQREALTDATEEAEQVAAADLAAVTELTGTIGTQLEELNRLREAASSATAQAQKTRIELDLLAGIRMPRQLPTLAAKIKEADSQLLAAKQTHEELETAEAAARQALLDLGDKDQLAAFARAYEQSRTLQAQLDKQMRVFQSSAQSEQEASAARDAAAAATERAEAALEITRQRHAAAALAASLHVGENCPVCQQPVAELPHHDTSNDLTAAERIVKEAKQRQRDANGSAITAGQSVAAAKEAVSGTRKQLAELSGQLEHAPGEEAVRAALAAIAAAAEASAAATSAATVARTAVTAAEAARSKLSAAERASRSDLTEARDQLVHLGAPPITEDDLLAAWQTLLGWLEEVRAVRQAQQPDLEAAESALATQVRELTDLILQRLVEHGVGGVDDPDRALVVLAERRTTAHDKLTVVRERRKRARALDKEISKNKESAAVAAMLGDLMRANVFERWLVGEALDSLVEEASQLLMELSGDQYELDRNDRNELVVIDYNDAGTQRPVQTLSGGETFQASLALALALSRQVVGLSAGMRDLNSMFLDEGFGTLDDTTLDTVASTLERLAADKDRMVGVITHVPALADRVPVQFVVSRDGATSRLRRVVA